jgi:hypothetical protein
VDLRRQPDARRQRAHAHDQSGVGRTAADAGVKPALGILFNTDEDKPGRERVARRPSVSENALAGRRRVPLETSS